MVGGPQGLTTVRVEERCPSTRYAADFLKTWVAASALNTGVCGPVPVSIEQTRPSPSVVGHTRNDVGAGREEIQGHAIEVFIAPSVVVRCVRGRLASWRWVFWYWIRR